MRNALFIALASALVTAGAIKAAPALAQEAGVAETYVSHVRTADLDLGSAAGQRRLQQRLAQAAREVCGTASESDLEGRNEARACRDQAIARASSQREALLAAATRGEVIAVTAVR